MGGAIHGRAGKRKSNRPPLRIAAARFSSVEEFADAVREHAANVLLEVPEGSRKEVTIFCFAHHGQRSAVPFGKDQRALHEETVELVNDLTEVLARVAAHTKPNKGMLARLRGQTSPRGPEEYLAAVLAALGPLVALPSFAADVRRSRAKTFRASRSRKGTLSAPFLLGEFPGLTPAQYAAISVICDGIPPVVAAKFSRLSTAGALREVANPFAVERNRQART